MNKVSPVRIPRQDKNNKTPSRMTNEGDLLSKESDLFNGLRDVSSRDGLSQLLKLDGARLSSLKARKHSQKRNKGNDSERLTFPFCEEDGSNRKSRLKDRAQDKAAAEIGLKAMASSFLTSTASALICTILEYFCHFSFAAVIFSHEKMQGFIYMGFVANLIGYMVSNMVYGAFGTFNFGVLSSPSFDVPVMAGAMATVANRVEDKTKLWPTAFMVMCGVTITLGLMFMLLGRLKLLAWTNFIPTPVVSGFLAGNGIALMKSAFVISSGKDWNLMTPEHYGPMFEGQSIALTLPAIFFGSILSIGNWKFIKNKYPLAKPQVMFIVLFIVSNVIFYIVMAATGSTIEQAIDYGWLFKLSEQAKTGRWWSLHEISYANLTNVDWEVAADAGFVPSLTATIIVLLGQAMRSAGMSELTGVEGNQSHDSVVVGGGNVLVGLMGGRVMIFSSVSLLNALLTDKKSRVATWMCAVVGFCFLSVGHLLMAYAPKFICGGALFFLGVDTINQTVVANFHKLPTSEFITLISVLAVYILINPMYGMGLGVFLTTGIFVAQYVQRSSESVITDIGTGKMYRSTQHRSLIQKKMLAALSGRIIVAKIQGYLFFGNTSIIKERLRAFVIQEKEKEKEKEKKRRKKDNNENNENRNDNYHDNDNSSDVFLILNMNQVVGCDTTAINLLLQFTRQMHSMFNIHTICAGVNPTMYRQFNQHGLITQLPQFSSQDCTVLDTKTGHGADNSSFFGFKRWQLTELEKRFCIFDDGTGRIELSDPELLSTILSEFGINATVQQVSMIGKRMKHCYDKKRVGDARINWIKIFFRILTATITDTERDIMYEVRNTIRYVDSAFGEEDSALQWVENQLLSGFEGYMKTRQQQSVLVLLENSHLVMAEGGSRRHLKVLSKLAAVAVFSKGKKKTTASSASVIATPTASTLTLTTSTATSLKSDLSNTNFTATSSTSLTYNTNSKTSDNNNNNNNTQGPTGPAPAKGSDDNVTNGGGDGDAIKRKLTREEVKDTATTFDQYDLFTQVVTAMVMEMELADRMVNGSVKEAIESLRENVDIENLAAGDRVFQTGQTVHRIVIVLKGSLCVTKMLQQKRKSAPYRRMVRERVLVEGNVLGYTHYYWKHRPIARWNAHAVTNGTVIASLKFSDLDNIHREHSRLASFAHFMFCGDACRDATERLTQYSAHDEQADTKKQRGQGPIKRKASQQARHRRRSSRAGG